MKKFRDFVSERTEYYNGVNMQEEDSVSSLPKIPIDGKIPMPSLPKPPQIEAGMAPVAGIGALAKPVAQYGMKYGPKIAGDILKGGAKLGGSALRTGLGLTKGAAKYGTYLGLGALGLSNFATELADYTFYFPDVLLINPDI